MMTKLTSAVLLVTLLSLLAGCRPSGSTMNGNSAPNSGTPEVSRASQKFDACSLLTKEDVESFLAEPVGTPATTHTEAMGNTVTQCR